MTGTNWMNDKSTAGSNEKKRPLGTALAGIALATTLLLPAMAATKPLPIERIALDKAKEFVIIFGNVPGVFPSVPNVLNLDGPNHRVVMEFSDATIDKANMPTPDQLSSAIRKVLPAVKDLRYYNIQNAVKPTARIVFSLPSDLKIDPRVVKLEESSVTISFGPDLVNYQASASTSEKGAKTSPTATPINASPELSSSSGSEVTTLSPTIAAPTPGIRVVQAPVQPAMLAAPTQASPPKIVAAPASVPIKQAAPSIPAAQITAAPAPGSASSPSFKNTWDDVDNAAKPAVDQASLAPAPAADQASLAIATAVQPAAAQSPVIQPSPAPGIKNSWDDVDSAVATSPAVPAKPAVRAGWSDDQPATATTPAQPAAQQPAAAAAGGAGDWNSEGGKNALTETAKAEEPPTIEVPANGAVAAAAAEGTHATAGGAAFTDNSKPSAVALYNVAVQHHLKGKIDEAIADYKAAIEANPTFEEAHSNLGLIYNQMHDYARALDEFHKALAINPKDAYSYNGIGAALRAQKDLPGAIRNWQTAVDLDPKLATAHYNLGTAYEIQHEYDKALDSYKDAVRNDYRLGDAYYRMGLIMQRQNRLSDAEAQYKEALKISANSEYSKDAQSRLASLKTRKPE